MQYRLGAAQPLQKAIPEIVASEIDAAIARVSSAEDGRAAVHAARKHLKRSRAVLSLVQPVARGDLARISRKRLAAVARLLAGNRDSEVAIETARELEKECEPGTAARAFSDLSPFLKARRERIEEQLGVSGLQGVTEELAKIKASLSKLNLGQASMRDLLGCAAQTYRKGRRAMKEAAASGGDEHLHEWRKLAQLHWRHVILLKEFWPQEAKSRIALTRRLCDLLGKHNDLAVMHGLVRTNRAVFNGTSDAVLLCRCIEEKQKHLLKKALSSGGRLYAQRPKALARLLRAHLEASAPDRAAADRLQT